MCYFEWLAYQLRSRRNEGRTYCHILPMNNSLVSLRLKGIQMERFISRGRERKGREGRIEVCVSVFGLWGSTNKTIFSQQKEGVKERIGRAQSFDFTLEIQSPRTKLRKPPRSNFQCLSQLIHHGVIAVSLLSRLRAADEPQLKASIRIPYLQHWPGRLCVFVCDCTSTYSIYGCSLPRIFVCMCSVCICVFVCTLGMFTWPLQGSFITPTHGRHLLTSISQTALRQSQRQSQN